MNITDVINLQLDPDRQLRAIALMAAATAVAGRPMDPRHRVATAMAQDFYEWLRQPTRPQDR
jgi:hypothetical protein